MIQKILIANRGEIAVRIIRACKEMNIQSVAVYSTADAQALHVQLANEAICIGSAKATESYLNMNNIIEAALLTKCDAIHPGFGFLSENSEFARLVQENGLIFIGPDAGIIEKMGNKTEARKTMKALGIPVVQGCDEAIDIDSAYQLANEIGYPIMIKAVNGGGGKGMRIVQNKEDFIPLFEQARQESKACFDSDEMYIEKYIQNPKHIEVQVACDHFKNAIHLYERDCSFQIRNQKMIEEAPCFILDQNVREKMCNDAIKACLAVGYDSIGTVEFLLDKDGSYYFMEMNTRIQVEHPITETITGIDLVKLQIRIANHLPLSITQEDISCDGYAMECRINAQDIHSQLQPSCGTIKFLNLPGGKDIRIDGAIYSGLTITPYYDAMLVKIIAHGKTRLECIKKMRMALEEFILDGIETNEEFHYVVLHQKKFIEGCYDTSFASTCLKELIENESISNS
ncbi:acetyl-CoA carboxylase biotin carboxylase subunit [Floccifex sp.]|uniref:acetyl-CoA carboxylase biotin carboxylase subunit n=1 Tax=Floccifex sp. TaxID=2815810 RepID=UPI003F01A1D1